MRIYMYISHIHIQGTSGRYTECSHTHTKEGAGQVRVTQLLGVFYYDVLQTNQPLHHCLRLPQFLSSTPFRLEHMTKNTQKILNIEIRTIGIDFHECRMATFITSMTLNQKSILKYVRIHRNIPSHTFLSQYLNVYVS